MTEGEIKAAAKAAFKEGWRKGHNVEELGGLDEKTIETQFERWWKLNYE